MHREEPPDPLVTRLRQAVGLRRQSRAARLMQHPHKALYVRLLRATGRTHRIQADTFYGGRLDVVLPEGVSASVWRYGFFEEEVCVFMMDRLKEGMTFVDVGSHVGFFSVLGARLVGEKGRVIALEPSPDTRSVLANNVRDHANVRVVAAAASDTDGETVFYDFGPAHSALNSSAGVRDQTFGERLLRESQQFVVPTRRLDGIIRDLGLSSLDCVKIDAESSEMSVLLGMQDALTEYRPAVILELGDLGVAAATDSATIVKWLMDRDYSPYEFDGERVRSHSPKGEYGYCNLMFLPKDQGATAPTAV